MTPFSLRDRARLWLARARGQDMLSPRLDPVVVRRGGYPGSDGEHQLQKAMGTQRRAVRFYERQMLDHLSPPMVEFIGSTMGLHINGKASVHEQIEGLDAAEEAGGRHAIRWVRVDIEEAYIHCSKHVPLMERKEKTLDWGTSNPFRKGGDFFAAVGRERPWKKDG